MGQNQNAIRQDLLRGLRWGGLLLLSVLLAVAFYRMTISSEAVALEPELAPATEVVPEAAAPEPAEAVVFEVGEPAAPPPLTPVRPTAVPTAPKAKSKAKAQVFVPPPATPAPAPAAPVVVETVDVATLPDVAVVDAAPAALPAPTAAIAPDAPPPAEDPTMGDKARGIVRSVGRIFRFGRKDNAEQPAKDEKEK